MISDHELARLKEIADLDLVSNEVDQILQEIAAEAADRLDLPVSLVSIVLDEAQHFLASHGVEGWMSEARGTPAEWSFCAHAVRSGEPFVVEDATEHPALVGNPLVSEDGIRCYAGIPLVSSRGHALGTLCVLGPRRRSFTDDELATLRTLAGRAVERIERRRQPATV
jgi:GAF domain-containing protein